MTDRELMLEQLERLAIVLDELMPGCAELVRDAIALLKKQNDCENCAIAIEDRQPVIRCKYCKHSIEWYGDKRRCFLWNENGIDVFEDGFCNYGKMRDNNA
jgi:Zn finger protein HypA/HybF involved in hydrogenase expression